MKDYIFISESPLETPENGFDFLYTYKREGGKVLHLIRAESDDLTIEGLTKLGHVIDGQYVFESDEMKELYEVTRKVGAHAVNEVVTLESGEEFTIEKPYMFGLFA